jgi:cell division septal protein FtsQ
MGFLFFSRKSKKIGQRSFSDNRFQEKIRDARRFNRPILTRERKPSFFKRIFYGFGRALAALVLLSVVAGGVYLVFFSDYFSVRAVRVQNDVKQDKEQVAQWIGDYSSQRFWGMLKLNNWLFLSRNRAEKFLKTKTPQIFSVTAYKRIWPDTIELALEERFPVFVWKAGGEYFNLDKYGTVYESLGSTHATSTEPLVVVDLQQGKQREVGENLDLGDTLGFMRKFQEEWMKKISVPLAYFEFDGRNKNQFTAVTDKAWSAFVDSTGQDAPILVENLRLLLTQEIGLDKNQNLSYIDLRIPQKAYYCYKNEPCAVFDASSNNQNSLQK